LVIQSNKWMSILYENLFDWLMGSKGKNIGNDRLLGGGGGGVGGGGGEW